MLVTSSFIFVTIRVIILPFLTFNDAVNFAGIYLGTNNLILRHTKPQEKIYNKGVIMKAVKYLTIAISLLISLTMYAQADQGGVEAVVTNYVKSIDANNADALAKTVLPGGSIIVVNDFKKDVEHYSTDQLVNMVKNKQVGGWTRNLTINSVDVNGNIAVAKVDITDTRLKQTGYITLLKNDGLWKVASQVTTLQLNKN